MLDCNDDFLRLTVFVVSCGTGYGSVCIYGNVYLGSRVLYAIYMYVHNVHVHIIRYKATGVPIYLEHIPLIFENF